MASRRLWCSLMSAGSAGYYTKVQENREGARRRSEARIQLCGGAKRITSDEQNATVKFNLLESEGLKAALLFSMLH